MLADITLCLCLKLYIYVRQCIFHIFHFQGASSKAHPDFHFYDAPKLTREEFLFSTFAKWVFRGKEENWVPLQAN